MKLKLFTIVSLLTTLSFADSSCWPEELLVGKTATGFIESINYKEFKIDDLQDESDIKKQTKCMTQIYDSPTAKIGKDILCEKIQCIKGECGDMGDHTALPIEASKDLFVQVNLKEGKKAWLKLKVAQEISSILPVGKIGTIFPLTTKVLDAPNGKPLKIDSTKKIAYTVKQIKKVKNEEWAEVDVNPIKSSKPPVEVESPIAKGYFLFRNKESTVMAVLSDIWCD
jgi:hypothetical protein